MTPLEKNAIVLSLRDSVTETIQLAESLGYPVVQTFIQHKNIPDVNYYIGSGKVKEIQDFLEQTDRSITLAIVDGELRPSQWFLLEKQLNITVYDRIRLILAIFEERAERKEARFQVKLAQLRYERPYVRELIHRARAGEHPGFMAGGEYQVDDYYEMIKKQMKKIKNELEKIRNDRELHRQTRYKSGFYLVSLAGYTNAGKSSLLNLLSDETVKVEGRLFSTLSTTTRKIQESMNGSPVPILLTDTVGFIEDLPSWIIDAFHSTLEEIERADVVLLVVDGSAKSEEIRKKLQVSLHELSDLGVTASIVIAVNKIDLLSPVELDEQMNIITKEKTGNVRSWIPISVKNKTNIDLLLESIYHSLPNRAVLNLRLPVNQQSQAFVAELYRKTRVVDIRYNSSIQITVECNMNIKEKLLSTCQSLKGSFQ
jgi:GTP-binding protein HflX